MITYGRYIDDLNQQYGVLTKYESIGDQIWRRKMYVSNTAVFGQTGNGGGVNLDEDTQWYYMLYIDEFPNTDKYTFGRVSSSGNGLGAFQYAESTGETVYYEILSIDDRVGRLTDGSVRNDSSDLVTYPFNANKLLFDDLATPITNKKVQVSEPNIFDYSGSPALRPTDFGDLDVRNDTTIGPLTEIGTVVGNNVWDFSSGNRLYHPTYRLDGRTEFSVETWVKFDTLAPNQPSSSGYVWDQSPGPSGASLRASDTTDLFTFFVYPEPSGGVTLVDSTFTIQTGVWYHTVGVYENGTTKLYINGELDNSTNGPVGAAVRTLQGDVPLTIGSSAGTEEAPEGEIEFTTPGQYEFTVPSSVSSMNMVLVGGGGGGATTTSHLNGGGVSGAGGGGGSLMWRNGLTVSAGDTLYITVGAGGSGGTYDIGTSSGNDDAQDGGDSYVRTGSHTGTIVARAGGGGAGPYNVGNGTLPTNGGVEYSSTYGGGGSNSGGGNGGRGGRGQAGHQCGGGGGAGGYSGAGGSGSDGSQSNATAGTGGAGGGGGGSNSSGAFSTIHGGGGVGIYGEGASGNAGTSQSGSTVQQLASTQGFSGSGGTSTDPTTSTRQKGYGGGGQGVEDDGTGNASPGAGGAVRLVWGTGRSFPTTLVGKDEITGGGDSREYMDGEIGEVRVYPKALTAAAVFQNYNATKSKYTNEAPDIAPKIGPGIVYGSNLLLNYDFGNRATYNTYEYPIPSNKISSTEQKITASDAAAGDQFGGNVAIGYSKIFVGATGDDDNSAGGSGSVYVYDLDGTNESKITASDASIGAGFGSAIAIGSGKVVIASSTDRSNGLNNSGSVYVYDPDGTNEVKIVASDVAVDDRFGGSIAVGSGKVVVGVYRDDDNGSDSGSVYVYDLDGTNELKITPSDGAAGDKFGASVAVGNNKIFVGAVGGSLNTDGTGSPGSVYVYDLDGTNEVKITPSDSANEDRFGSSIAVSFDRIVIGARGWGGATYGNYAGAAYIFDLDLNELTRITASDIGVNDFDLFGSQVKISDDRIFINSFADDDNGIQSGSVYVYDLDGTNELKITPSDGAAGDNFGSIAVGSGKLVVGARNNDDNGGASGSIYIYDLIYPLPTTVKNLSSSSYTGTLNGGSTFNPAGYFDFDGVDGYIDTGLNPGAVTALTVEAWLRVDTYTNDGSGISIGTNQAGTGQCYLGRGNSGGDSMDWRFYTGTFLDETEFFTSDTGWKHYVGTYDQTGGAGGNQGRMRLYVDGNLEDTALSNNTSAIDFSSGENIRIGVNTNGSSYFDGKYGEIRIYNRALTATEVSQNFNATRSKYGV